MYTTLGTISRTFLTAHETAILLFRISLLLNSCTENCQHQGAHHQWIFHCCVTELVSSFMQLWILAVENTPYHLITDPVS